MIKEVSGDILLSDSKVIAHCVAPNDHFDSGLALGLRERYPSMAKDFRHYCHLHNPSAGEIWSWGGVGGMQIVNLMAQEPAESRSSQGHPGKASISNLNHCLKKLAAMIETDGIDRIAIPRLATGVGGLNWEEVQESINQYLGDSNATVYVYTQYNKGEKAMEA